MPNESKASSVASTVASEVDAESPTPSIPRSSLDVRDLELSGGGCVRLLISAPGYGSRPGSRAGWTGSAGPAFQSPVPASAPPTGRRRPSAAGPDLPWRDQLAHGWAMLR